MNLKSNSLFVVVDMITAEVIDGNIYTSILDAKKVADKHKFGAHAAVKLSDYLDSLLSWYGKNLESII